MWSKEAPTVSGFYWFYGDPFWLQLPHDEEKGINPFKPGLHMVECKFVRDGFAPLVTSGAFMYEGYRGVFWTERIQEPKIYSNEIDLTMPCCCPHLNVDTDCPHYSQGRCEYTN